LAVVRINQSKLELRDSRELLSRLDDLGRIQPRNLHQDPIGPDRTNDGLAAAEIIDALANHLDGLVEIRFRQSSVALGWHKPDEEGSAALNIEAELNFFARGPDRHDAENDEQHHEQGGDEPFSRSVVGREIPPEENEQNQPDKEVNAGLIYSFRTFVTADFSISIFTLSPPSR
jgi:hypothetical protein